VAWIYVVRDRDEWQTFANTVMNHRDPLKAFIVLTGSATDRFSRCAAFIYGKFYSNTTKLRNNTFLVNYHKFSHKT
jgi:hypothetical protein